MIELKSEDLKVTTGEERDNTVTMVTVEHIPSGISVRCNAYKTQRQNCDAAKELLKKLLPYEKNSS